MKCFITILLISATRLGAFAQSMGIRFNDRQGREFVVYAPSGQFSYSMYEGDYITRDYEGRVTCVGNTYISYNYYDQVTCIGDIYISYDSYGRVVQVGGLFLTYDYSGNITNTSGRVRNNSNGGQNSGYYIKQSTVKRNWKEPFFRCKIVKLHNFNRIIHETPHPHCTHSSAHHHLRFVSQAKA